MAPCWDSYGASVIDPRCTAYALELLRSTMRDDGPAPAVVPTSRVSHILYEDHQTGTKWEGEVAADVTPLRNLVSKLPASIGTNDKRIADGLHAEPRAS